MWSRACGAASQRICWTARLTTVIDAFVCISVFMVVFIVLHSATTQSSLPLFRHLHRPTELSVLLSVCRHRGALMCLGHHCLHHSPGHQDGRFPERNQSAYVRDVSAQVYADRRRNGGAAGHHSLLLPRLSLHRRPDRLSLVAHVEERDNGRELQAHLGGDWQPVSRPGSAEHMGITVYVEAPKQDQGNVR